MSNLNPFDEVKTESTNPFGEYEDEDYKKADVCTDDGNPFGEYDVEEYSKVENEERSSQTNPFGEFDDEEYGKIENLSNTQQSHLQVNNRHHESTVSLNEVSPNKFRDSRSQVSIEQYLDSVSLSDCKPTVRPSTAASLRSIQDAIATRSSSSSRQSLSSTGSEMIRNYSLGSGVLEKEGLLCPDCLREFRTITELMGHFEAEHHTTATSQSSTKKSSLVSPFTNDGHFLSGFVNKFKNATTGGKLELRAGRISPSEKFGNTFFVLETKPGPSRSHTDLFRQVRDVRIERYVYETNKLLIRLDRMLRDYPPLADTVGRRKHEQTVVDWLDDTAVPLCPTCAKRFSLLTRNKHHCRLCGAVMCGECSEFLDFDFAFKLITPAGIDSSNLDLVLQKSLKRLSSPAKIPINKTSLMAIVSKTIQSQESSENANRLRVCDNCFRLLVMRKQKLDEVHRKPRFVEMYDQLQEHLAELKRLLQIFVKMADSLNAGETTYNLRDAQELKAKLPRIGEKADRLSRRMEQFHLLPGEPGEPLPVVPQRHISLQNAIRRATVATLRECLLALAELPDETRLECLQKLHQERLQQKIMFEKEMALKEQQRFKQFRDATKDTTKDETVVSFDQGFCTHVSTTELWKKMTDSERDSIINESDPLLQQINIIRSYIRQAKQDHRYEEVRLLEENLKELEIEFYFNQEQNDKRPIG